VDRYVQARKSSSVANRPAGRNSYDRGNGYSHATVLQVFQATTQQVITRFIPGGATGQPGEGFLDNIHDTCLRHGINNLPARTRMPSVAPGQTQRQDNTGENFGENFALKSVGEQCAK